MHDTPIPDCTAALTLTLLPLPLYRSPRTPLPPALPSAAVGAQVHQGFVDGAVCASNPALMAFARVLESYPHVSRRGVRVLSLSCGDEHAFMPTNGKGEVRHALGLVFRLC